ncbi:MULTISPECIES: fimbria/pilus periplasmic chaperone [Stenotrophomonas maltophilia group]|uniref:fimbria/pilus periplasmic chaperone n=1 Tax=Stenotrophomonas maltophilia group TaxID=995085 RepID=UPI0018D486A2|nr:fimbria/pilus periplasmic chaperone [Stenotrophomonas maltophilia]HDS1299934.1 fimbria/pilus periplasmic chaperone [Stenotrophomonas maltophilia]HDS1521701.1 fimbria/pilus periplasmic chaperone [Stenotrophomonas maltophilia]HDS1657703.1 fimbria/pilus periplasmic chaperone [Stenotrophomonas maltophilia]HDS1670757.1 fimbria/pilus periplasmic chaperone [Stenotrophomonas maltophilia]
MKPHTRFALLVLLMATAVPVSAAVTLQGTRVVYDGAKGAVTVTASNRGQKVALAQVWLDDGDIHAKAGSQKVPFVVTPTTRRIDAGRSQAYRLTYAPMAGTALPQERESLLYFNLLDIPPKPEAMEGRNVLQFAMRTRVKLFYRPAGLTGHARDAANALVWSRDGDALQVHNPSAYHVTFSRVTLPDGRAVEADMVAPGMQLRLPLPEGAAVPASLSFQWLDDYGTPRDAQARVQG